MMIREFAANITTDDDTFRDTKQWVSAELITKDLGCCETSERNLPDNSLS